MQTDDSLERGPLRDLEKYYCNVRQDTSGPQDGKLAEGSEKPALLEVPVLRTALCELAENAGQ